MAPSYEHLAAETRKLMQGLKKLEEILELAKVTDSEDVSKNRDGKGKKNKNKP